MGAAAMNGHFEAGRWIEPPPEPRVADLGTISVGITANTSRLERQLRVLSDGLAEVADVVSWVADRLATVDDDAPGGECPCAVDGYA